MIFPISIQRKSSLATIVCWFVLAAAALIGSGIKAAEPDVKSTPVAVLQAHTAPHHGLRVEAGRFTRDGAVYRGIGVNFFDCFMRMLADDPAEAEAARARCEAGFAELRAFGIPFVRFNASGFYPKDWRLYQRDPQAYFARLDALVAAAEKHGVGLVPSLFWFVFTPPVLADEPVRAWGDPASKTHALMRRYVEEVAARYRGSPAIWAWEFGNEYNLGTDFPDQPALWKKWFHPSLGMPAAPRPDERLTSAMMQAAWTAFAETARKLDPHRPLFTGNAMPRTAARHLRLEQSWAADTRDAWIAELAWQNPDPVDALSVHFYPFPGDDGTGLKDAPLDGTLDACAEAARASGKPLWLGEFAAAPGSDLATRAEQWRAIIAALEKHGVTLAAAWVYDFPQQPDLTFSGRDETRVLLEILREANQRWLAMDAPATR